MLLFLLIKLLLIRGPSRDPDQKLLRTTSLFGACSELAAMCRSEEMLSPNITRSSSAAVKMLQTECIICLINVISYFPSSFFIFSYLISDTFSCHASLLHSFFFFFYVCWLSPSRRVNTDLTGFVFLKMNATCGGSQSHGSVQQLRTVSVSSCMCVHTCVSVSK